MVTGSSDGSVRMWDVENGRLVRELVKDREAVWNVGWFDNNGERVVAAFSRGGEVVVEVSFV